MQTKTLVPRSSAGQFGAFCCDVARIGRGLPTVKAAAPSTFGTESVGADGGYLVPPDFRAEIVATLLAEDSLFGYAHRIPTSSNSVAFPADAAPPWTGSGIVVSLDSEGTARPPGGHPSKFAVQGVLTRLEKITAFVPMSSELYEDAPGLSSYLDLAVRSRILFKLNDLILNGDGVGKPLGILQSGALLVQAKEGAQAAATVNLANVQKMWAQLYGPSKRRAVWIANSDVEAQLQSLSYPTYINAGATGNELPLLLGRPVVYTEASPALGQQGDLVLADMGSYAAAIKTQGKIAPGAPIDDPNLVTQVPSIHVFFDNDMVALRFVFRFAGQPIWNAPITRKGAGQVSTFVALGVR